jgi:uncharacterized membrane protein YidH (DUF202 family)
MKKIGLILLLIGVLVMGYAAFKFVKDKKLGSEEQVQDQTLPFPWLPTTGALLIASGIIVMGSGGYNKAK